MLIERRACTRPSRHRGMVARGWQYQTSGLNAAGLPYTIGFSYAEDGNYNAAAGSSTLTIMDQDGPLVFSLQRYGYHWMPTTVVLTFNQALDATTAQDPQDYRIIGPAGRTIRVKEAVYDPAANTVTLHPARRIDIHYRYKLIVDGTAPGGLTNTQGQLLDGTDSGEPGSDYSASLTWRNLVLGPPAQDNSWGQGHDAGRRSESQAGRARHTPQATRPASSRERCRLDAELRSGAISSFPGTETEAEGPGGPKGIQRGHC